LDDENILPLIPVDVLRRAAQALPPADTCQGHKIGVEIEVPNGLRAIVVFASVYFKGQKARRWIWTPESAERIE
jgi:hypothetical protein